MSSARRPDGEPDPEAVRPPDLVVPRSECPACGAHGLLVDSTRAVAYFVCPVCENTWRHSPGRSSDR